MRLYLFAAAVLSLSACTTARDRVAHQAYHDPQGSEPIRTPVAAPVSTTLAAGLATALPLPWVAKPARALGDLFGRRKKTAPVIEYPTEQPMPKKCKGCTFVYGDATLAGKKATVAAGDGAVASHIEKKAGPAVVASDSSTQNAVLGGGNIQATTGNNNAPQLSAPVQQALDWRAELAKPVGQVAAVAVSVVLLSGLVYGFILWRKKKAAENLV